MVSNNSYIPKIYKEIHEKLKQESRNDIIERKQMLIIMGRCFHYPNELKNGLVKGLEKHNLIMVLDKFKVQVI